MGRMFDWSRRGRHLRPRVLQVEPVVLPAVPRGGLAYRKQAAGRLVPQRRHAGARAGRRRRPPLLALRDAGQKRDLEQWYFRITNYADELLDFGGIEWPERDPDHADQLDRPLRRCRDRVRAASSHHAGGEELACSRRGPTRCSGSRSWCWRRSIRWSETLTTPERRADVEAYVDRGHVKTEIDRLTTEREKTGVAIGAYAINPDNGARVPIYVADYVLGSYGTGAIMAVPAHDERDFEFARKFGLPIVNVVMPKGADPDAELQSAFIEHTVDGHGQLRAVHRPPDRRGLARDRGLAGRAGQGPDRRHLPPARLAGQPPALLGHADPDDLLRPSGIVPVPDDQLPVLLPETVDFHGSGENPLARDEAFLNAACPSCGGPAKRETDTMDTFVDSSWYWFRYLSRTTTTDRSTRTWSRAWMPVEQYTGGVEHAVMHLLYIRFCTKAMRDIGLVEPSEPFRRLFNQGIILGPDGERMTKSRGNVQDPDELVARYGADTFRLFLMFIGPWDQGGPWSPTGISGVNKFLHRVSGVRDRSPRDRRRRSGRCRAAGRRDGARRPVADAGRGTSDAARRHGGLRGLPLEHDGRQADGAVEPAVAVPGHVGRRPARVGRGGAAVPADAGAGGAAHRRGAVVAAGRGTGRGVVLDPHAVVADGRRQRDRRGHPRGADPGQRQAARQGHRAGRDLRDRA